MLGAKGVPRQGALPSLGIQVRYDVLVYKRYALCRQNAITSREKAFSLQILQSIQRVSFVG